mgnify:CR=1 FL=1
MAMVELDQMKFELQSYENTLHEVKDSLDLEGKKKRIEELEMEMEKEQWKLRAFGMIWTKHKNI